MLTIVNVKDRIEPQTMAVPPPVTPTAGRSWRGLTTEQRVAERRERLLAAALEIFAAKGFGAAKVRDVCREAKLTERYFYESFTDKEALLMALGDGIVVDLVMEAGPAITLFPTDPRAALSLGAQAVVSALTDDPRKARILFVEVVGVSPAVEDRRRALIGTIAQVVGDAALAGRKHGGERPIEVELIARSLIGAAQELLVAFAREELDLSRELLVASVEELLRRASTTFETISFEAERATT